MKARLSLRSLLGATAISTGLAGLRDAAAARVRRESGTIDNNDENTSTRTPSAPESETP